MRRRLLGLVVAAVLAGCGPAARHLAIANGNHLRVIDTNNGQEDHHVTRYQEILHLTYRPDGERLAVDLCFGNRIVELEAAGYAEVAAPITASSCPWSVAYAPDGQSLAAIDAFYIEMPCTAAARTRPGPSRRTPRTSWP